MAESVNVLIIFAYDPYNGSDLLVKGWKIGELKCPYPHAGNTLLYTLPYPFFLGVDLRTWNERETNTFFAR